MTGNIRFFSTYSGVRLPFNLVGELQEHQVQNRNTFFRGYFDGEGRLTGFDKIVYGETELTHRYTYRGDGKLASAEITDIDGERTELAFGAEGEGL